MPRFAISHGGRPDSRQGIRGGPGRMARGYLCAETRDNFERGGIVLRREPAATPRNARSVLRVGTRVPSLPINGTAGAAALPIFHQHGRAKHSGAVTEGGLKQGRFKSGIENRGGDLIVRL